MRSNIKGQENGGERGRNEKYAVALKNWRAGPGEHLRGTRRKNTAISFTFPNLYAFSFTASACGELEHH